MPVKQGDFVWYELMTSDVTAATEFYAHVVGWTIEPVDMGGGFTYYLGKIGDRRTVGMMDFPPDIPPGAPVNWSGYVVADDVDAKAEELKGAGGSVIRAPDDIPGVGRFSVVADPKGAVFLLFKGAGEPAPDLPYMTPGTVGWHELHAKDYEAEFAFYEKLFGWSKDEALDMGEMGIYQLFRTGGAEHAIGGMMNQDHSPMPYWLYYFAVDDIDAALARATDKGATVQMGPIEVPGGAFVFVAKDPQDGFFAVVGMRKG